MSTDFTATGKTATKVSDFFIKQFSNTPEGITNLKLQKLLYFAYVWNLTLNNTKLFDDIIEAWNYGPVIRNEYNRLKSFCRNPIPNDAIETNIELMPEHIQGFLNTIWYSYGKRYSAGYLVDMTHSHTPWRNAFYSKEGNQIITDNDIKSFYTIDRASELLPEGTIIREHNNKFELVALNQATIDAINTPISEYLDYS